MTDVSRQLTEAKQVIRSILITAPNGLTVRQLISDYKKLNGKELQFREFGYANPTYFLQSMPEVVKLEWSPSIQDFILKGIADESTKHIDSLVKRSKRSKKNTHNFPNSRSSRFDKNLKTSNARPTKRFVTADLKNKIQELLCCYKSGILLSNFELAFYKRFGINLDLKLLGFSDLEEFLKEMPDIVRMEENGKRVCSIDSMKKREEVFPKDTSMKTFNENERNHHNLLISNNKTYTTIEITPKKSNNEEKYNNQSLTNKLESSQNLSSIKNILFECPTSENNDIKEELHKVLSCHPDGIWATDFMKKYEEILKKELNLTEMGYSSLIELVSCFPDIFFIHQPELCKDNWLLLDVNNSAVKSLKEDTKKDLINSDSSFDNLRIDDEPPIDDIIKANVLSILHMTKKEIPLDEFERLYKARCQVELPWASLGYDSIEAFIVVLSEDIPLRLFIDSGKVFISADSAAAPESSDLKKLDEPVDIPSDAVLPGVCYTTQPLPQDISNYIGVYVSTVDNPGQIWFQIRGKTTTEALDVLMGKLEHFYNGKNSNRYKMPDTFVGIDHICAALWTDDNWHRGIITGIPSKDSVEVLYVDYGTKCTILRTHLRFLKKEFMILPIQAIKGRLANIKPSNGRRWCEKSKSVLLALCRDKPLAALVTNKKYKERISLCLCDVSEKDDLHINDALVREGLAILATDPSEDENMLLNVDKSEDFSLANITLRDLKNNYLSLQHLKNLDPVDSEKNIQSYLNSIEDYKLNSHHSYHNNLENGNHSPTYSQQSLSSEPTPTDSTSFSFKKRNSNENIGEIFEEGEEFYDKLCEASEDEDLTVTRVTFIENYKLHIINCHQKPYVCNGDIESLFQTKERLEKMLYAKNLCIPSHIVERTQCNNLFQELERCKVRGMKKALFIILYPLEHLPEILLRLKHPSRELVKSIELEITYFYFKNNSSNLSEDQLVEIHQYEHNKRKRIIQKMVEDGSKEEYVEEVKNIEEGLQLLGTKIKAVKMEKDFNLKGRCSSTTSRFSPVTLHCDKKPTIPQKVSTDASKNSPINTSDVAWNRVSTEAYNQIVSSPEFLQHPQWKFSVPVQMAQQTSPVDYLNSFVPKDNSSGRQEINNYLGTTAISRPNIRFTLPIMRHPVPEFRPSVPFRTPNVPLRFPTNITRNT